jgi:hypothetical protein
LKKIKIFGLLMALSLLVSAGLHAQNFTTVTGTITDPSGIPYAGGTISAVLTPGSAAGFTLGGFPYAGTIAPSQLSATGSFTLNFGSNAAILPSGTKWLITVNSNPGGIAPPLGTGAQTFTLLITISGASQNITTALEAVPPPALTNFSGAGPGAVTTFPLNSGAPGDVSLFTGPNTITGSVLLPCANLPGLVGFVTTTAGTCTTIGGGEVPSFIYTFFPSTSTGCALNTYSPTGTTYCAVNGTTGNIDYSGPDAAVVINSAWNATAATGGLYQFANGIYNALTLTLESNNGCTNYYAFGIPVSTATGFGATYILQGASATTYGGEVSEPIATNGVILNVTPAALATVSGSAVVYGLWQRPMPVGSGCTIVPAYAFVNTDFITNITVRFPTYTRGNTGQFVMWAANAVEYNNDLADWNQTYSSIAAGSAPPTTSICMSSTYSNASVPQKFTNTFVVGCNVGYDLESEHVIGNTMTGIYNNWWGQVGLSASIYHPIVITHAIDQENLNSLRLANSMIKGSRIDLIGYDIELGTAGWFTRSTGGFYETNSGFTSGIITYAVIRENGSVTELPAVSLFTKGGQNFLKYEGLQDANDASLNVAYNYSTLANNPSYWGGGWQTLNACSDFGGSSTITSGVANGTCQAFNGTKTVKQDQFSAATINGLPAASVNYIGVTVRVGATTNNYYEYDCSTATGRQLLKVTGGVRAILLTVATPCAATNTIKLEALGSSPTYLIPFYNGAVDYTMLYTDTSSPFTTGYAGMVMSGMTGTNGVNAWSGGTLPENDSVSSMYTTPEVAPLYMTLNTCISIASPAVCGSAAAGSVDIAAAATTIVVNTTAVTANSQIFVLYDSSLGTRLGVTCNTTEPALYGVTARTPGTSFTITATAPTINSACFSYFIIN